MLWKRCGEFGCRTTMPARKAPAFRADGELPPSALLITSPGRLSKHVIVGRKARAFSGYKVHFTEMCETNEPHLIVDVIANAATTPAGKIMEELDEQLAQQD